MLISATALHVAVYAGLDNVTKVLLPQGPEALHLRSGSMVYRGSPFRLACTLGCTAIAGLLLQHGSNVNEVGWRLRTPLYDACERGDVAMAKLLVQSGANVSLPGIYQYVPASWAMSKTRDLATPLEVACAKGRLEVVQMLIRLEAVKIVKPELCRGLKRASKGGHAAVVKELLAMSVSASY